MVVRASPEIESVMRRVLDAWDTRDFEALSNLCVSGNQFRGIGTDADELSVSGEEFVGVRRTQAEELLPIELVIESVEAFKDGSVGWAVTLGTIRAPDGDMPIRLSTVFAIEAGVWRIVHWHLSLPTPNVQAFGVELTTTLHDLLASVSGDSSAIAALTGSEGTMTLVFTDIVDSTAQAEAMGDTKWVELVARHESVIREVTESHGGSVVKMLGDGSMLAFDSARAAIRASVDIQRAFEAEEFSVRIGVHAGDVVRTENDILGLTVNKAARVAAAAEGGTIMVSSTVIDLVGSLRGVESGDSITVTLKGLSGTHQLVPIEWNVPLTRT